MLEEVPFGGLSALVADERVGLEEAILAADLFLDDNTIRGRNGYRAVLNTAGSPTKISAGGELVQGYWRFQPTANTSRTVVVAGGKIWLLTDPTTGDLGSDGASAVLNGGVAVFGTTQKISGVALGKNFYLSNDQNPPIFVRIRADLSLETIGVLGKGTIPTAATTPLAVTKFTSLSAPTRAGGAVETVAFTDWHTVDNGAGAKCPAAGSLTYDLGSDQDYSGVNWLCVMAAAPTSGGGGSGGILSIAVGTVGGVYEEIGVIYDTPGPMSCNYGYYNLNGISSTTRSAVRKIKITLTKAADYWAAYGIMPIPGAPPGGPQQYRVTFVNSTTGQESEPTDTVTITYNYDGITIPTYHSIAEDHTSYADFGTRSLDPDTADRNRCFNIGGGIAMPKRYEFAQVNTLSGTIPTASLYPNADRVRLWRLASGDWRLVRELVLSSGATTTYALRDDQGTKVEGNLRWLPHAGAPQMLAMGAAPQRLVTAYQNRITISDFAPFGKDTDPYPQFSSIPIKQSDGWGFDIAPSNAEQIQQVVYGDTTYILTNEAAIYLPEIQAPLSGVPVPPVKIINRGALGRNAGIWAEEMLFWVSVDGVYAAVRTDVKELSVGIRRFFKSWFLPDSNVCIGYQQRKLYVFQDKRFLRYDFVANRWTYGTLAHTIRRAVSFSEPSSSASALVNRNELFLLTDTLYPIRWTDTATEDLQVGTTAGSGTALPDWVYSTGYRLSMGFGRTARYQAKRESIASLFMDATGDVSATAYNSADTSKYRRQEFVSGETEKDGFSDWLNYKHRLNLKGKNATQVRRVMWGFDETEGVGT